MVASPSPSSSAPVAYRTAAASLAPSSSSPWSRVLAWAFAGLWSAGPDRYPIHNQLAGLRRSTQRVVQQGQSSGRHERLRLVSAGDWCLKGLWVRCGDRLCGRHLERAHASSSCPLIRVLYRRFDTAPKRRLGNVVGRLGSQRRRRFTKSPCEAVRESSKPGLLQAWDCRERNITCHSSRLQP